MLTKSGFFFFFFKPDVPDRMFFQTGWIHFRYPSRKEAAEQRRGEEVFFKLNKKWNALDLTHLYDFPAGQLDFQLC